MHPIHDAWSYHVLYQEEYYATHQFFLTNRSLYLLVWSVKDGVAGLHSLKPWLENIEVGASFQKKLILN